LNNRSAANPQSTGCPNPSEIWQPAFSPPQPDSVGHHAGGAPKATLSLAASLLYAKTNSF